MNTAKSYKFILLTLAVVMSFMAAFLMLSFKSVSADSASANIKPDAYFDYNNTTTSKFENNNAIFTLTSNDTIEIENTVVVNNFFINFKMNQGIKSVNLVISTQAHYDNGNKVDEDVYKKEIDNQVLVNADGSAKFNDNALVQSTADKIYMRVDDNGYYSASVDGVDYVDENRSALRVKTSNEYQKLTGKVKIEIVLEDGVDSVDFEIISLSQNADNNEYLQTFTLIENAIAEAKPIICLTDNFKVKDGKVIIYNEKTTITYNVYSFLDGISKSKTKLNLWYAENDNDVFFGNVGLNQIKIIDKDESSKEYLTIQLNVLDKQTATTDKPVYTFNQEAYDAFLSALKSNYVEVYDNGTPEDYSDDVEQSVALGTTIEIPSLSDLVSDDYTSYKGLSYELYYSTPNSTTYNTKSELKLTLNDAGKYLFFVVFKDAEGNLMEKSDFIIEEDGEVDKINSNVYGKFVFSFNIQDDASISITPASTQGKGYKGTSYTASKFTLKADGCTVTYKLFYNADIDALENSQGWIEIPAASTVTNVDYNEDGYDYDDIKNIAYNGSLSFTPDKVGSYMIECVATSKVTAREATAQTLIRVENEPTIVKPASEWLQNNVWSVVFLSIGTVCLIGIIILLCIKPKEEKDN